MAMDRGHVGISSPAPWTAEVKIASMVISAVVILSGLCSCAKTAQGARTVALTREAMLILPAGSPSIVARHALTSPSSRFLKELATPEHLSSAGPLPARAVLSFHIGRVKTTPFLAWLSGRKWIPVPSNYNARAGIVSASLPHFSTWAPFTWASSPLEKWIRDALHSVSGNNNAADPICQTSSSVTLSDSNISHHTIGACAQEVPRSDNLVAVKVVNERDYPIDVSHPATVGHSCGQFGPCIQATGVANLWVKLGAALSLGGDKELLPGGGTTTIIVEHPQGEPIRFKTTVDVPAMYMAFLEAGINVFTTIIGGRIRAVAVAAKIVSALDFSECVSTEWQRTPGAISFSAAGSLAVAAFKCVGSILPDVVDALGLRNSGFLLGAFNAAVGLVAQVVSSGQGLYDSYIGNHTLTLTPGSACPSPHDIQQAVMQQKSWASHYYIDATGIMCVGPYVVAPFYLKSIPHDGGRVLLEQQATGLRYLAAGSGPFCTTNPSDAGGDLAYVPKEYAHALRCYEGNGLAP